MSYIERLPVSDEVRGQLRSLAADTPEALLGLIHAAPREFESMVGADAAQRIRAALRGMVPEHLHRLLETPPPSYGLGATLHKAPALPDAGYDLEKRDRLFAELQQLRSQRSEQNVSRIAELENELNGILEKRAGVQRGE